MSGVAIELSTYGIGPSQPSPWSSPFDHAQALRYVHPFSCCIQCHKLSSITLIYSSACNEPITEQQLSSGVLPLTLILVRPRYSSPNLCSQSMRLTVPIASSTFLISSRCPFWIQIWDPAPCFHMYIHFVLPLTTPTNIIRFSTHSCLTCTSNEVTCNLRMYSFCSLLYVRSHFWHVLSITDVINRSWMENSTRYRKVEKLR